MADRGTITAWRLVKAKYAATAFDGEGARLAGGRFNRPGTTVVYCADSLALALLEVAVHLPSYALLAGRLAFPVTIPEALVEAAEGAALPQEWRDAPVPRPVQQFGDAWVQAQRTAVLRVPSVVVTHHHNYVLNPAHPDFARLGIGEAEPVMLDPRLIK